MRHLKNLYCAIKIFVISPKTNVNDHGQEIENIFGLFISHVDCDMARRKRDEKNHV